METADLSCPWNLRKKPRLIESSNNVIYLAIYNGTKSYIQEYYGSEGMREFISAQDMYIYIYVYRDRMNNSLLFWEKLVRLIIFQDDIYFLARTPDLPTVCIDSLTLTFAAKYLETHLSTHKDSF